MPDRSLLFYNDWPLGYHNREAERKARALARAAFDVVYVTGVGFRNPSLGSAGKLADRTARKLRSRSERVAADPDGLATAALAVTPPRQVPLVRRANVRWVRRQLARALGSWDGAVAWIRHLSPEVVEALPHLDPALVVYECVDAYHLTSGATGRWARILERTERALVEQAGLVIVTSESLADRLRCFGADPRYLPHGVDLFPWRASPARAEEPVLGFLGMLDWRLDPALLRFVAESRPRWQIRLVGPVERGFDPSGLEDLANLTVEGPVPHARIGEVLNSFDVGIMPYRDFPFYRHMSPLKNLELMAAGKPAVARPNPALECFGDLLYFAGSGKEFVDRIERALADDSPALARARRTVAEHGSWDRRLDEMVELLREHLPA